MRRASDPSGVIFADSLDLSVGFLLLLNSDGFEAFSAFTAAFPDSTSIKEFFSLFSAMKT
jgi:hypothetical protein